MISYSAYQMLAVSYREVGLANENDRRDLGGHLRTSRFSFGFDREPSIRNVYRRDG
jgi:hypothetical protein